MAGLMPDLDGPLTPALVEDIIRRGPLDTLRVLTVSLSLDPPEDIDVESLCLRLSRHEDAWVRGNAMMSLGHLARTLGRLDPTRVRPVLQAALNDDDPQVRGKAEDAISDIRIFMGWSF